jgi:phosphoenolpyruvate carboxykinase (ATP)
MLSEALANNLEEVEYETEPVFGLQIPKKVDGVPDDILAPRNTWSDPEAYDMKARELAKMFKKNFDQYEEQADEKISAAGPQI